MKEFYVKNVLKGIIKLHNINVENAENHPI